MTALLGVGHNVTLAQTTRLPLKKQTSTHPNLATNQASGLRFAGNAGLLDDRRYVIDFSAPVTGKTVGEASMVLRVMAAKKRAGGKGGSIKFIINSPGGSVTQGLKLLAVMQHVGVPIDTVVMGQAASMGAILAVAGAAKGRRFMDRHAQLMIHQPSLEGASGTSSEMVELAQSMTRLRNMMEGVLSQHTQLNVDQIKDMLGKDTYISPLRALKDGFVDWVLLGDNKVIGKDAIKGLSDADIDQRDRYNKYDDLKSVPVEANNAKRASVTTPSRQPDNDILRILKQRGLGIMQPEGSQLLVVQPQHEKAAARGGQLDISEDSLADASHVVISAPTSPEPSTVPTRGNLLERVYA